MAKSKKSSLVKNAHSEIALRPLVDRVVIKPLSAETKTASGIIIPDTAKEKPDQGTVVAVGPGKFNEDGDARIPMGVKVGDRVMFSKYGYDEVKIGGVEYYVVSENNILAILE
ncbi:MAG TPA: co-chaperone GroES [Candidatus Paceibacterota bacterium]